MVAFPVEPSAMVPSLVIVEPVFNVSASPLLTATVAPATVVRLFTATLDVIVTV